MEDKNAFTHIRLIAPGAMRLEADPLDAALKVAIEAQKNGASKSEAAMIFARAHCAAYGCPGCFEDAAR